MSANTFVARTHLDGAVLVPIIHEFTYMGHAWVVHNSIKHNTELYRVSHKETGFALRDYRNQSPSYFDTVEGAEKHTKLFLAHVGKASVDHWVTLIHAGQV